MKRIAFLVVGLATAAVAQTPLANAPLVLDGSFKTTSRSTSYTVILRNSGSQPITNLAISQIGLPGHEKTYRPKLMIPTIKGKGQVKIQYTLKGELITLPDPRDYGFTGEYRYGRDKVTVSFPNRDKCRVNW